MKKIFLGVLFLLSIVVIAVAIVLPILWLLMTGWYFATAATLPQPTPTPHLLPNSIEIQPLLDLYFVPTQATFEDSLQIALLKNSPHISFPAAAQTPSKDDLHYLYSSTTPAGLLTSIEFSLLYNPEKTAQNCTIPHIYVSNKREYEVNPYSYCVSYLQSFPDTPGYFSSIEIQKPGLTILINEQSQTTDRQTIHEALQLLVQVLTPPSP